MSPLLSGIFSSKPPVKPGPKQLAKPAHEPDHEVSVLLRYNTQVAHRYRAVTCENSKLVASMKAAEEQCRLLAERNAELEAALKARDSELHDSAVIVCKLQSDIEARKGTHESSVALVVQLASSLVALEQQLSTLDAVRLAQQLGEREDELCRLRQQLAACEQVAAQQAERECQLRRELQVQREAAALRGVEQQAACEALFRQLDAVAAQHAALQLKHDAAQQQAAERVECSRREEERWEQARRELEGRVAALAAEAAGLSAKLTRAQDQEKQAKENFEAVNRDLQMTQRRLLAATERRVDVEKELEALCGEDLDMEFVCQRQPAVAVMVAGLMEQLEAAKAAVTCARQAAQEMIAAHRAKWRSRMDAKQAQLEAMAERVRELEARLAEARRLEGSVAGDCGSRGVGTSAGCHMAEAAAACAVLEPPCEGRQRAAAGTGSRNCSEGSCSDADCGCTRSASMQRFDRASSDSSAGGWGQEGPAGDEAVEGEGSEPTS